MSETLDRREFLARVARLGVAGVIGVVPAASLVSCSDGGDDVVRRAAPHFSTSERRTLDAALERMIPADGPGDWSAADVGAGDYIERLLTAFDDVGPWRILRPDVAPRIYAGGPFRADFGTFRPLPRAKEIGWRLEVERLQTLYAEGLAELDRRAGGDFAGASAEARDLILLTLDLEGSPFFAALYAHTMEGVYAHPVYGGNRDFRAWQDFAYAGDVHGVRFPDGKDADASAWNRLGGYAPEEMVQPGAKS